MYQENKIFISAMSWPPPSKSNEGYQLWQRLEQIYDLHPLNTRRSTIWQVFALRMEEGLRKQDRPFLLFKTIECCSRLADIRAYFPRLGSHICVLLLSVSFALVLCSYVHSGDIFSPSANRENARLVGVRNSFHFVGRWGLCLTRK